MTPGRCTSGCRNRNRRRTSSSRRHTSLVSIKKMVEGIVGIETINLWNLYREYDQNTGWRWGWISGPGRPKQDECRTKSTAGRSKGNVRLPPKGGLSAGEANGWGRDFRVRFSYDRNWRKRHLQQIQQQISKPKPTKAPITSNRMSQKKSLAGVVVPKRKREEERSPGPNEPKKTAAAASTTTTNGQKDVKPTGVASGDSPPEPKSTTNKKLKTCGAMQVIGILPGLGNYRESTDSEESSDTDCDEGGHYDWVGRKIVHVKSEGKWMHSCLWGGHLEKTTNIAWIWKFR